MRGVNIHLDTHIGKRLSTLSHTLTNITGDLVEEENEAEEDIDDDDLLNTEDELPIIKVRVSSV